MAKQINWRILLLIILGALLVYMIYDLNQEYKDFELVPAPWEEIEHGNTTMENNE